MTIHVGDGWNAGNTYEGFMGRWSRPLAREFIGWLNAPPDGHWLDVGTGTGALAAAICELAGPASVVACDSSAPFIAAARGARHDPRVTFLVAGAADLPLRERGYDAVVSGLALNFFLDPQLAIAKQLGAVHTDGLVGAFVWDYAGGMEFLRHFWDAAITVDPKAEEMDEGRRFPICHPEALEAVFRSAGAQRLTSSSLSVPTTFSSFDDYWLPFLGGTGPAPGLVAALTDEQRLALVAELKRRLGVEGGGPIELQARAWAVAGHKA